MRLYGGKSNKGKHSSAPAHKSPEPEKKLPEQPAKPLPRSGGINSDSGTSYGAEPHFASDEYVSREEKRASRKWLRRAGIIAGVILLLIAGVYAGLSAWIRPPDVLPDGPSTHTQPPDDPGVIDATPTPEPIESAAPDTVPGEGRRPGTYTFLITGLDVEGNHTDTNIIGMMDIEAGELNFVNIPRDTLINVGYDVKKINYVYPACVNNGKDGVAATLDAVEDMLGYPVDFYAIIDIQAAAELVDAIGGVWYDIPFDMDWDAPDQTPPLHIHIKQGYQLLDGANTVNALRFRYSNDGSHSYVGGDIQRIAFQQDLLMAIAKQMLTLGNIPNLGKVLDVYEQHVNTNLEVKHLAYFATEFLKLGMDSITFQTLPGNPDGWLYGMSYVYPDIDAWLEMVNEYLNPFYVEITRQNVNMLTHNGLEFVTTQGYIAGGEWSFRGSQA